MNNYKKNNNYKNIEHKLQQAACLMPTPEKSFPVSPAMEKRRLSVKCQRTKRIPVWRIAVTVLLIFIIGGTTTLAASPGLRASIARFFTSGITEEIPVNTLESKECRTDTNTAGKISGELSGNATKQTVDSLTLVQDVTLDSHFTASYVSSPNHLSLKNTPSGIPLFCTRTTNDELTYYRISDNKLEKIAPTAHSLTATVKLTAFPGIMTWGGNSADYKNLELPAMEFTVNWKQYGTDILIEDSESTHHFTIDSTYYANPKSDYEGMFYFWGLEGQSEIIEVFFSLDAQMTNYSYPFLLNLTTGEISDPLANIDFSDWKCLDELAINADLTTATAMAGSSHEDLREITIDLTTGIITAASDFTGKPPVDDCITSFLVGEHSLFYVSGTEKSGNGCLYDTQTGEIETLFTNTSTYAMWDNKNPSSRGWESIGGGYVMYFAENTVSLINLKNGGTKTILENIPASRDIDFLLNNEHTALSITFHDAGSFNTSRLCLLDLKTMNAWYFDRELPDGVEEWSNFWNGKYEYVIEAQNTKNGMNYLYLYQYIP